MKKRIVLAVIAVNLLAISPKTLLADTTITFFGNNGAETQVAEDQAIDSDVEVSVSADSLQLEIAEELPTRFEMDINRMQRRLGRNASSLQNEIISQINTVRTQREELHTLLTAIKENLGQIDQNNVEQINAMNAAATAAQTKIAELSESIVSLRRLRLRLPQVNRGDVTLVRGQAWRLARNLSDYLENIPASLAQVTEGLNVMASNAVAESSQEAQEQAPGDNNINNETAQMTEAQIQAEQARRAIEAARAQDLVTEMINEELNNGDSRGVCFKLFLISESCSRFVENLMAFFTYSFSSLAIQSDIPQL